jgi:LacI family transcriptional regulator
MKKQSHITLDDIARRMNVSRVTVSKALRGHPDISEQTTRRVRELAHELGYSPNIIARTLSARRSNMLGLVIPKIAHFFFSSVIEAVYNTAFDRNYETILTVSQENAERERKHLQTLVSMRVDGIIVSISQETHDLEIFRWIRKMGIPVVFVDRAPEPPMPEFSSVVVDDRGGAILAIDQAYRVGYRKIACIGGHLGVNIGKHRIEGFTEAMNHHGLAVDPDWVVPGGFGKEDGYNSLKHLHALGKMPEFVFAMTYPIALGVYESAIEMGIRIPQDLDIICFGDGDANRFLCPSLSCISQPTRGLGSTAVQMLLDMISHPEEQTDQHVTLPTELVLRDTCSSLRGSSLRNREALR